MVVFRAGMSGGRKTMTSWYWKVCGEAYDESHS